MGDVMNRETKEILRVNTPDYVDNPAFLVIKHQPRGIDKALPQCDKKYWKVLGNEVVEMSEVDKQVIDDQLVAEQTEKEAETERERLIQERIHKNAEDELIAEGTIEAK